MGDWTQGFCEISCAVSMVWGSLMSRRRNKSKRAKFTNRWSGERAGVTRVRWVEEKRISRDEWFVLVSDPANCSFVSDLVSMAVKHSELSLG